MQPGQVRPRKRRGWRRRSDETGQKQEKRGSQDYFRGPLWQSISKILTTVPF